LHFVLFYFFVWEPVKVYHIGQRIIEAVFRFMAPLVKVAPFALPIYTILFFCLYPLANLVFPSDQALVYLMFLAGFSIALHLVFGAKALKGKQGDFLKANLYIRVYDCVYSNILSTCFVILTLCWINSLFVNFFNTSYIISRDMVVGAINRYLS